MSERPILFSAEMVRAILDGRKTQTRRVMKPQPQGHYWETLPGYQLKHTEAVRTNGKVAVKFCHTIPQNPSPDFESAWVLCPYGAPGDLLWVREAFRYFPGTGSHLWDGDREYRADGAVKSGRFFTAEEWQSRGMKAKPEPRWRPSIHMPRWASRITIRITDVRVERVQDISEDDAVAEGVDTERYVPVSDSAGMHASGEAEPTDPIEEYRGLWNRINGPGAWEANPWVWAISFERVKP